MLQLIENVYSSLQRREWGGGWGKDWIMVVAILEIPEYFIQGTKQH